MVGATEMRTRQEEPLAFFPHPICRISRQKSAVGICSQALLLSSPTPASVPTRTTAPRRPAASVSFSSHSGRRRRTSLTSTKTGERHLCRHSSTGHRVSTFEATSFIFSPWPLRLQIVEPRPLGSRSWGPMWALVGHYDGDCDQIVPSHFSSTRLTPASSSLQRCPRSGPSAAPLLPSVHQTLPPPPLGPASPRSLVPDPPSQAEH